MMKKFLTLWFDVVSINWWWTIAVFSLKRKRHRILTSDLLKVVVCGMLTHWCSMSKWKCTSRFNLPNYIIKIDPYSYSSLFLVYIERCILSYPATKGGWIWYCKLRRLCSVEIMAALCNLSLATWLRSGWCCRRHVDEFWQEIVFAIKINAL